MKSYIYKVVLLPPPPLGHMNNLQDCNCRKQIITNKYKVPHKSEPSLDWHFLLSFSNALESELLFQLCCFPFPGFKNLKGAEQACVHAHQGTCIIKFSAVVWCREYGNQLPVCKEFVTVFNYLPYIFHSSAGVVKWCEPGNEKKEKKERRTW